jgi:hypothetical protein
MSQQWRPHVGSTLDGRYAIEQVLGEGPTGVVYAAEDVVTSSSVAVKVLHPALFVGPHASTNLLRLQRARAYVNPHVVRLRDVVVSEARVYTVTDRIEAPDLKRILVSRGPLLRREIPPLVEGIAAAMAWIHQIGVHGNLKPANIFVDDAGATTVGDPWFLEGTSTIGPGELVGRSAEWVAPEQLDTGYAERKETDVHGLARIIGRLLAGRSIQLGASLESQGVVVSEAVGEVLARALEVEPGARFGSVRAFADALLHAWDGEAMRAGPATGQRAPGTAELALGAAGGAVAGVGQAVLGVDDADIVAEADALELDDALDGLEIEEDAGIVVGSETESIPLSQILAMGLDPIVGERIEEVDAVVLEAGDAEFAVVSAAGRDGLGAGGGVIELGGGDVIGVDGDFGAADDGIIDLDDSDMVSADDEAEAADVAIVFGGAVAATSAPATGTARPPASWDAGAETQVLGGGAALPPAQGAPVGVAGASAVAAVTQRAISKPISGRTDAPLERSRPATSSGHRMSAVSAAESARAGGSFAAAKPAAAAAAERRNPMMIIAPLALVVALFVGWYVLNSARERRQAPPVAVATSEARAVAAGGAAVRGAGGGEPAVLALAPEPVAGGPSAGAALPDGSNPGGVAGQALGAAVAPDGEALAGAADAVAAPMGPDVEAGGGDGAAPADGPALAVAAVDGDAPTEPAEAPEPTEAPDGGADEEAAPEAPGTAAPGKLPAGHFIDPNAAECPAGMARIKRKKDVEMADGSTVKAYLVWCIDRYEYPGSGSVPQVDVGLAQAKSLCSGRGRRLCTRSEWRGACGAKYPYGREYDPAACNTVSADFTPRALVPSGSKADCKSGWGLYDMVGNAAEWTSEGYVNGGSSTKDGESGTCYRSARRTGGGAYVGFRCCADAEGSR